MLLVGWQIRTLMVAFMNAADGIVPPEDEWSPPCDVTIQFKLVPDVLRLWYKSYKGVSRSLKV